MRTYGNGKRITEELLNSVCDDVLKTIKEKLPKEYQCQVIIADILSEAKNKLGSIPLDLQ